LVETRGERVEVESECVTGSQLTADGLEGLRGSLARKRSMSLVEALNLDGFTLTLRDVATDRVSEKAVDLRETEPGIGEGSPDARV